MCKHGREEHDTLVERQKRLDARGNDVRVTNRESEWALRVARNLPPERARQLMGHVRGMAQRTPGDIANTLLGRLDGVEDTYENDPWALVDVLSDHEARLKDLTDRLVRTPEVQRWYDDVVCPNHPYMELDRGRKNAFRVNERLTRTRHGGITVGAGRSGGQHETFDRDVRHGHGMFRPDTGSETWKKLNDQGAPFVGGSSGTLRFIALDFECQRRQEDCTPEQLREREEVLAMHAAMLVVAGHHSVSECVMSAQALGYFTDLPSPLEDYDGAMRGFEQKLHGFGLDGGPLSKASEEQGKSDALLAYEKDRDDVLATLDRYRSQMSPGQLRMVQRALDAASAAADAESWQRASQRLEDARGGLDFVRETLRQQSEGSPRVLDGAGLIEKFGGRKPHKSKKKSKAYKQTVAALDAYRESSRELLDTPMSDDYSDNALAELRKRLAEIESGAQAYVDKHGTDPKKQAEVAEMLAVIAAARAEAQLLQQTESNPTLVDAERAVTLREAIEYTRKGVNLRDHARIELFDERKRKTEECRYFGSGGINTVRKIVWDDDPNPDVVRIWKPDPDRPRVPGALQDLGIDPNDPKLGKRNVATSVVANNLGLGSLVPDTKFAVVDGEMGIAMTKARGQSLQKDVDAVVDPPIPPKSDWERFGIRKREEDGVVVYKVNTPNPLPLEDDPKVDRQFQEQSLGLQWLDCFCGQVDRHERNYLVELRDDRTVQVCGIDNDFSFGSEHDGVETRSGGQHLENMGRQFCGLPPLIDGKLYDRLRDLTFEQSIEGTGSLLDEAQRRAARLRFEELQEHAQTLFRAGCVVYDWKTWRSRHGALTAKEYLLRTDDDGGKTNYYRRDLLLNRRNQGRAQ